MKQYLDSLKILLGNSFKSEIKSKDDLLLTINMNGPASDEQVLKCNLLLDKNLPDDYKHFLKHYNGGILFDKEGIAGYKFLSTSEIVKENKFQEDNFGEDWDNSVILFCLILGNAEYIAFRVSNKSYQLLYCSMDVNPISWHVIDGGFDEFVNRLLEEQGKEYWLGGG